MEINHYSFGKIIIEDIQYNQDLIVTPTQIINDWWRSEGHLLQINDLAILEYENIQKIIVGRGFPGLMKIDPQLIDFYKTKDISLFSHSTPEAIKQYNLSDKAKTILILHLTC